MRALCAVALVGISVLFAGCASKEPMDYLPECQGYLAVNAESVRTQPGAKRLLDVLRKLDPKKSYVGDRVKSVYLGVSEFKGNGAPPTAYGVILGTPGSADAFMNDQKSAGGTDTKIGRRKAVQAAGGAGVFVALTDSAVLFATSASDFETMEKTAKKKNPSALNSPLYQKVNELHATHGISATWNPQPAVAQVAPMLNMLAAMNAKAVEALKEVNLMTVTLDWEKQPRVQAVLLVPQEDGRQALAGLAGVLLQQAKSNPAMAQLPEIEVLANTEGVQLAMAASEQSADQMLTLLEEEASKLPEDPAQREQAVQAVMMRVMGALGAPAAPGQIPAAQP